MEVRGGCVQVYKARNIRNVIMVIEGKWKVVTIEIGLVIFHLTEGIV